MSEFSDKSTSPKPPGVMHLVAVFAGFSALWIILTDHLLNIWFTDQRLIEWASMLKGLLFVAVTSILLYGLLRRASKQARLASEREYHLQGERVRALNLLDSIATGSTDAIFAKDLEGRYILFNPAAERNVGKLSRDVLGKTDSALFPPEEAIVVMADDRRVMAEKFILTREHTLKMTNGVRVFLTTLGPLYDDSGGVIGVFGIGRDITERKRAEDELLKLSLAVEQSPEHIIITDLDARIEYVNASFITNTGYSHEEVLGKNPRLLQSGKTSRAVYADLWKTITAGHSWQGELYNRRKDGSEYTEHAIISPVRQKDGRVTHYMAIKQDITKLKIAEEEIKRLAFYDLLTGLPNRTLLLDRLTMVLPITLRQGRHDGLLVFNLDRFKNINDTGGQEVGDALLKEVAIRLRKVLRGGDMLARISGDEFAILLIDLAHQEHTAAHLAMHIAEKIHFTLREVFLVNEAPIMLTASIGISLFPISNSDAPLEILRRANSALHLSKAAGGALSTLFDHGMDEISKQRVRIERELALGIPDGQLRLYLQPQVDSGKTVGAEALVRWQHPELGLLQPGIFIPIAEESDLIIEVGRWVFRQVCLLLKNITMLGRPFRIAVNISPRQFRQNDFAAWIKDEMAVNGIDPTRLTLEITEGVVISDINSVIARMNELTETGIHFSIDDFGTGYSSLAYLKRLPIHEIKIDKIFVQDAPYDPDDAALVETILSVARHMHLRVVAEGVETQEQADFLNARASVTHQGYLYGVPEPAESWAERLV